MERAIDKFIILLCCIATLFLMPQSTEIVVGLLAAIMVSALREISFMPKTIRKVFAYVYLVLAVPFSGFVFFVPLMAYDCFRVRSLALKMCWIIPLIFAVGEYPTTPLLFVGILSLAACALSWRTDHLEHERLEYKGLRDELRELSLTLEHKNQDLLDKQDYEVNLATLSERGRIAREIHDNVGHLLTRSVLQIEALQVVHAEEPQIKSELAQVGETIHEAFETVRESVHDLHDDAFDLHTQLLSLVDQSSKLVLEISYQSRDMPNAIGYCFIAIVREALANAAKHSDAGRVKISVLEYPAFWQLIIHDNGSKDPFLSPGFMQGSGTGEAGAERLITRGSGIGLKTMEERARSLGGVFRVNYDKGLRVFVSVPKTPERL